MPRPAPDPDPCLSNTQQFSGFTELLDAFARDVHHAVRLLDVDAVLVGVAGPVVHNTARLTNIPWDVRCDAAAVTARFLRATPCPAGE